MRASHAVPRTPRRCTTEYVTCVRALLCLLCLRRSPTSCGALNSAPPQKGEGTRFKAHHGLHMVFFAFFYDLQLWPSNICKETSVHPRSVRHCWRASRRTPYRWQLIRKCSMPASALQREQSGDSSRYILNKSEGDRAMLRRNWWRTIIGRVDCRKILTDSAL